MLICEDLEVGYGAVTAVNGLSFSCDGQEIVSIVGANGAGKSTLMNALGGYLSPRQGEIRLDGVDITRLPVRRRVGEGVALVAEGRQIWPELSVEEHLRLGWFGTGGGRRRWPSRLAAIEELFPKLGQRRRQDVGTLSGGEQQMVVIGRALIAEPRVLLLDEPSLGLAPVVLEEISNALIASKSADRAVVVTEQNADFALGFADRGYVMQRGELTLEGDARELAKDPQLTDAYLAGGVA
ncbi:ABC transporter ATP-binding protein [Streptomyces sp. NPDC050388]|uniref:ABC transporter ATP-binding protein n=1 Tax=Streptomyces sp. NPDC050388 TaxID=3155781 RepID=UPI003414A0C0